MLEERGYGRISGQLILHAALGVAEVVLDIMSVQTAQGTDPQYSQDPLEGLPQLQVQSGLELTRHVLYC